MLKTLDGDKKAALCLKKSLYGISVATKLWYEHLLKGLKELGFKPSSYDKCMLYKDDMLLITFVDDCGLRVNNTCKVDWFNCTWKATSPPCWEWHWSHRMTAQSICTSPG
jgi:hypothetical protein